MDVVIAGIVIIVVTGVLVAIVRSRALKPKPRLPQIDSVAFGDAGPRSHHDGGGSAEAWTNVDP
jgi:hypothetical protein